MSTSNTPGKNNNNMLGLRNILREKIGFTNEQLKNLYGQDLIKSFNLYYFYKYLNNNKIIPENISSIFDICNICKTDFNLTQELDKILPNRSNSNSSSEKFYGIVLESSRTKKKIKILKVNNDPKYLVQLLLFLKNNLTISQTGMCKTLIGDNKITLHLGEKDMLFNKDIKLCVPKSKFIIEKSNTNNTNIRNQYKAGNIVEFVGNTNKIKKMNGGQRGGLAPFILAIILGLCLAFVVTIT
jgi:hypothetical protein